MKRLFIICTLMRSFNLFKKLTIIDLLDNPNLKKGFLNENIKTTANLFSTIGC